MPETLATVLSKVQALQLQNAINASLIEEFYQFMKENQTSESYQKINVKVVTYFAQFLNERRSAAGGDVMTFYDVNNKELILEFLDSKLKSRDEDPDQSSLRTWNDYLNRIKFFFRWLHNVRLKEEQQGIRGRIIIPSIDDWITPSFVEIKSKNLKKLTPYSATEIWEIDEVLTIVKYEPNQRNKAAIMLLWDLDARNHEVTNIELRNIRLKDHYAEGEIPEGKTGSGPILLTASFPYVRDWLNLHPLKDYPRARLICHTSNGKAIKPDYLWTMMKQLKIRIHNLIKEGHIKDEKEKARLEFLLKTKKWNPYCFRHSAITHDSDYLPGYALNKKVRWSMNSKQPGRYIKNRMGDTLKKTILNHNGITTTEDQDNKLKLINRICPKYETLNALENDYCSKKDCGYPLTPAAYDEIKKSEKEKDKKLEEVWQALYAQGLIKKES